MRHGGSLSSSGQAHGVFPLTSINFEYHRVGQLERLKVIVISHFHAPRELKVGDGGLPLVAAGSRWRVAATFGRPEPSAVSRQPSAASHQPPAVSRQPPAASRQPCGSSSNGGRSVLPFKMDSIGILVTCAMFFSGTVAEVGGDVALHALILWSLPCVESEVILASRRRPLSVNRAGPTPQLPDGP